MIAVLPSESSLPAWNRINNSRFPIRTLMKWEENATKPTQTKVQVIVTLSIWHSACVCVQHYGASGESWWGLPSHFIKKKSRDMVPRSICFICSQMEQTRGNCANQSVSRNPSWEWGIFVAIVSGIIKGCLWSVKGRETDRLLFIKWIWLALPLNSSARSLYIHSLPERADHVSYF